MSNTLSSIKKFYKLLSSNKYQNIESVISEDVIIDDVNKNFISLRRFNNSSLLEGKLKINNDDNIIDIFILEKLNITKKLENIIYTNKIITSKIGTIETAMQRDSTLKGVSFSETAVDLGSPIFKKKILFYNNNCNWTEKDNLELSYPKSTNTGNTIPNIELKDVTLDVDTLTGKKIFTTSKELDNQLSGSTTDNKICYNKSSEKKYSYEGVIDESNDINILNFAGKFEFVEGDVSAVTISYNGTKYIITVPEIIEK